MEDCVLDTIAAFYSGRADYPLDSLRPGERVVAGSDRRDPDKGGAMLVLHAFADRCMVSTRHELIGEVEEIIAADPHAGHLSELTLRRLAALCQRRLGDGGDCHVYSGVRMYCTAQMHVPLPDPHVRRITRANAPEVIARLRPEGMPDDVDYLLADDAAFAYVLDERPVAFAATHPVGSFAGRVGNVMVGTVEAFRRRGYGKAVVSATTGALLDQGRVALYGTAEDNVASIRTACAVGYEVCCRVFEVRLGRRPEANHHA